MSDDKLILNGSSYTLDKLRQLPSQLQPQNVFTKVRGDQVAFYSKHSPLSNHHISLFTVEGIEFNSNEQFLMFSKARFFNDELQTKQILDEQNPAIQNVSALELRVLIAMLGKTREYQLWKGGCMLNLVKTKI